MICMKVLLICHSNALMKIDSPLHAKCLGVPETMLGMFGAHKRTKS